MKIPFYGMIVVLSMVTLAGAHFGPTTDTDEAVQKKLQDLNKKIDDLRKQENELLQQQAELHQIQQQRQAEAERKEAERKRKAEADEKKKQVAKVEIRGKLVKTPSGWQVAINELTWTLNLGAKKELVEVAEKNVGKAVVITGMIANVRAKAPVYPNYPGIIPPNPIYPGYPYPQPPQPSPYLPLPQPYPPQPFPQPVPQPPVQVQVPYPVETPITVNVESLKVAQD